MTMAAASPVDRTDMQAAIARLEVVLDRFNEAYEALLATARERLEAIRASDASRLADCIGRESLVVQRIAELDGERDRLVRELGRAMELADSGPVRMSLIASRLEGDEGERMRAGVARLRERIEELRVVNEVSRSAAELLAAHMTGLLRAVSRHLNHAKTYSRQGAVDAGPRVVSALDVKS
jgi:hypothetical protein